MINSTAYYNDFWNEMRGKQAVTDNLYNNRESKTNAYHPVSYTHLTLPTIA